jgi:hypothetical protein
MGGLVAQEGGYHKKKNLDIFTLRFKPQHTSGANLYERGSRIT